MTDTQPIRYLCPQCAWQAIVVVEDEHQNLAGCPGCGNPVLELFRLGTFATARGRDIPSDAGANHVTRPEGK